MSKSQEAIERLNELANKLRQQRIDNGEGMNLLKETKDVLVQHNKTPADVRWVGNNIHAATWEQFEQVADFDYDHGYGGNEISMQFMVVGDDWWLERHEYDGSEWWEYKTMPKPREIDGIMQIMNNEQEIVAPPRTEEEMIGLVNKDIYTSIYTIDNKKMWIPVKDYLKTIDWFYEKYKLLFDGD